MFSQVTASASGQLQGQASGAVGQPFDLQIPNPQLWSPDQPFLYGLEVVLLTQDGNLAVRLMSTITNLVLVLLRNTLCRILIGILKSVDQVCFVICQCTSTIQAASELQIVNAAPESCSDIELTCFTDCESDKTTYGKLLSVKRNHHAMTPFMQEGQSVFKMFDKQFHKLSRRLLISTDSFELPSPIVSMTYLDANDLPADKAG